MTKCATWRRTAPTRSSWANGKSRGPSSPSPPPLAARTGRTDFAQRRRRSDIVADRGQRAAVDFPLGAVDVAGFVRKQEADHVAHFARLPDAVERRHLAELFHPRLHAVEHLFQHADQKRG